MQPLSFKNFTLPTGESTLIPQDVNLTIPKSASVNVDKNVITTAFILHDTGWSKMSDSEIASSLGVTGLALTNTAMGPKEKHAVLGEEMARKILLTSLNLPILTNEQKELIRKTVLFHDKPWELL